MSRVYDPVHMGGAIHGLVGATLHALQRAIGVIPGVERRRDAVDVAALRAMAEGMRSSDPSHASDLLAIAARHEGMRDSAESAGATTSRARA